MQQLLAISQGLLLQNVALFNSTAYMIKRHMVTRFSTKAISGKKDFAKECQHTHEQKGQIRNNTTYNK